MMRKLLLFCLSLSLIFSCSRESLLDDRKAPEGPEPSFIRVMEDEVAGTPIVLAGSASADFAVAFERRLDGKLLDFRADDRKLPVILTDQEGNRWDLFGVAVEGPRKGRRLKPVKATRGYWFAFGGMFPGVDIHGMPPVSVSIPEPEPSPFWLVDSRYLVAGAFFDQIRTIDDPRTIRYDLREDLDDDFYVRDNDPVIVVRLGEAVRAYPKKLLDWHEIINDTLNGVLIAVTYHPLSGTTMVWERKLLNYFETTLGISGLMYNINMVSFDRATNSYWSQLLGKCIGGPLGGAEPVFIPSVELTWRQWRSIQEKPEVISDQTGFSRNYQIFPYTGYSLRNEFPDYPIAYKDTRLPLKERVFGVLVAGQAKVYRMEAFR